MSNSPKNHMGKIGGIIWSLKNPVGKSEDLNIICCVKLLKTQWEK
jgi:hypothetical protein